MRWLSRLFGSAPRVQGFVYAPAGEDGPMLGAKMGATVRNPNRDAPWIVVDHTLQSIVVARWPGRLWHVEIVDAVRGTNLRADARYTRAASVKVLEELPAHKLFGEYGAELARVFDIASTLSRAQAERLAATRDPGATDAKNRLWQAWLKKTQTTSPHSGQDLGEVLALVGQTSRSPVESGLTVLQQCIFQRATAVDGANATQIGDDDDVFLVPPWSDAASALSDAVLAIGAPSFASRQDLATLLRAWNANLPSKPQT